MSDAPAKLRRFLAELRRRKVYQTGAAYAIGVFAIWQVIDIAGPALGWADSVLTFFVVASIALAPLVIALAWIFDVRREPTLLEPDPTAGSDETGAEAGPSDVADLPSPVGPLPVQRRPVFPVLAPALIAAAGITWILWPSRSSGIGSFEAGDPTLISECENTTGDANFDGVLNTALDATIRQSMYMSVLSHDRARSAAINLLGRTAPVSIDAATAREIGVRFGYKVVIHCAIRRVGSGYVVEASIMEPLAQTLLKTRTEQASDANDILDAVDRLAAGLRADLGESLRSVRETAPLAMVTTPSLDALFAYTAATAAWDRGELVTAHELFLQALQRDSLFAAAHAALGNYYYWVSDYPRGAEAYRKALSRPDRLSERDRLWIEAQLASNRGDRARAIALFESYLDRWPGDAGIWYNLGTQHFRASDCTAAGTAFARALAIDPSDASSHINLASCHATLGRSDSALAHYEEAFRMRPSDRQNPGLNHEFGQTLVEAGRIEEAEALYLAQLEGSAEQQASARRSLALLRVRQGRYEEARTLLTDAARQRRALQQGLSEYRDRLYLAQVLDVLGDETGKTDQVALIEPFMAQSYLAPGWLLRAFNRFIADGQTERSRAVLARAEADTLATDDFNRAAVHAMRALSLARAGRMRDAIEEASLATDVSTALLFAEPLCRVSLMADSTDLALSACERLADPAQIGLWESTEPAILANYWMGLVHERLGNIDEARQWFARFLAFWNEADDRLVHRDWAYQPVYAIADARQKLSTLIER